ncbi:CehA/McbA family metallohydrolase [Pendulispora rubella]|uniref:CehA/McbA family metallohydrolase n=1 Tax=Pendulispora rubella TaxID=2741070 RepID=A0ABZ2L6M0_9BACT
MAIPRIAAAADPAPIVFDGDVPLDGPEHFFAPFEVPEGIEEIEVRHDDQSETNILDFGLNDPDGYRGWGGGTDEPAIVGRLAASRAYVRGAIRAGTWKVVVGKAKVVASPARYHLEIVLRTTATLPEQKQRTPYAPPPPRPGRRYYAGDFHVHSLESTDAIPSLDEIATYAESRKLDFVEISDHNTVTQFEFFADAQARHPNLLFVPGIEYTTYHGHANAIGATRWVDHKLGQPGVTIDGAAEAIRAQGALFSINHPVLDLGDACIGCAWKLDVDPRHVSAIEIETGGLKQSGFIFIEKALAFWDERCAKGQHIAAIGGSDSHRAGETNGPTSSPIAEPTTMVLAEALSTEAILEGIRNGRTVVKLQSPADPMIELTSSVAPSGDTVRARSTILSAKITGTAGKNATVYFVKNGEAEAEVPVTSDPFVHEARVAVPDAGESRWRVEVRVDGQRSTITSHLFMQRDPNGPDPLAPPPSSSSGDGHGDGGCHAGKVASSAAWAWTLAAGAIVFFTRRRRIR